ncbi:MAG TPA: nickel pincer cofactor biosynthesis protein LarC [Terriglobia bacterium]|nr:nickel pincer cofactor biosynthesis protein LarC [Terriglobia bacterium]
MAKIAYLDCSSGISGDMLLAALLDAGLERDLLLNELRKLPLAGYEFRCARVLRGSLTGTQVEIDVPQPQPERHLGEIRQLLEGSALTEAVRTQALKMFERLAEVEGKLHGKPAAEIHFHEVGAVDAILDIVGACVGLELLEIDELSCSPLNVGGGQVETAHGTLPVPAPATAELLKGAPIYSSGVEGELVTPTGAVIVATLASSFGPMPPIKVARIGYGAGSRDYSGHPNIARLFVGERAEVSDSEPRVTNRVNVVTVIEANVDDMSPQLYGYLVERALDAGALDITCSSIQMKKNRPGLEISVLCVPERAEGLAQLLFEETTTIGLRIHEAGRLVLDREVVKVETPYGTVRVKIAKRAGKVINVSPEYEDCQRLAAEKSVPLKQVILAAQLASQE